MNGIDWFFGGVLLAMCVNFLLASWQRRDRALKIASARRLLEEHGLTPQLYVATIGQTDPGLRAALDVFASQGYVITEANGEVIGKLCPKVTKGPHLRLVVSNV